MLPSITSCLSARQCISALLFQTVFSFLLLTALPAGLHGQTARTYERAGDRAFRQKDYSAAMQHYGAALAKKKNRTSLQWKYAEAARMNSAFAEAEKYYNSVAASENGAGRYPLLNFRLGELRRNQGDYEGAVAWLEKFKSAGGKNTDPASLQRADEWIESCRWALSQRPRSDGLQIIHFDQKINSPYSDFAPVSVGDTLFFSSYRFDKRGDRSKNKAKITKILLSIRGSRVREPARGFPVTDSAHVAHTAFTPDGNFMFFTICKNASAGDIRCELWLTLKDRKGRWVKPLRLPEPVNLPGYTSTQPAVGYDAAAQGPVLWFASDRPGGQGGMDLWSLPLDTIWFCPCTLPEGGKKMTHPPGFAQPLNAGPPVNSAANEITPFFDGRTQTLWFSSDGRNGFGGYDIFSAHKDSSGLSEPSNAGPGLNSSYNDLYFFLRPDGYDGFFSSNRPGSIFLDPANQTCCNDIFAFSYPRPIDTAMQAKTPAPQPGVPVQRRLIPMNQLQERDEPETPKLDDFVGLPLFFDNDEPDRRTRRTTTRKTYEETAQAYLARQDEYRERFSEGLTAARREAAEAKLDAFFDDEVRRGYDRLGQMSEILLDELQSGASVEIVIKGFTSPRAESDYNLHLGKRRVSSVRNHFTSWNGGVLQDFLQTGQLKISEESFGETTARRDISDSLNDERNSIYSPDAARERRVEIVGIRRKQ
ncbi:MAG: hypothetical protein U0U46_05970 [Saprospiraceae bacterium]